jgi:hypothetical protein
MIFFVERPKILLAGLLVAQHTLIALGCAIPMILLVSITVLMMRRYATLLVEKRGAVSLPIVILMCLSGGTMMQLGYLEYSILILWVGLALLIQMMAAMQGNLGP